MAKRSVKPLQGLREQVTMVFSSASCAVNAFKNQNIVGLFVIAIQKAADQASAAYSDR